MRSKRGKSGRFELIAGAYLDEKGYVRISAGPQRNKRLHTIVAEAMLGRELKADEDVHHKDGNKLNLDWRNLQVTGHKEHGAISRKQAWYFRENDIKGEKEWNEFFDQQEAGNTTTD